MRTFGLHGINSGWATPGHDAELPAGYGEQGMGNRLTHVVSPTGGLAQYW
jgi:hypothetical protein